MITSGNGPSPGGLYTVVSSVSVPRSIFLGIAMTSLGKFKGSAQTEPPSIQTVNSNCMPQAIRIGATTLFNCVSAVTLVGTKDFLGDLLPLISRNFSTPVIESLFIMEG